MLDGSVLFEEFSTKHFKNTQKCPKQREAQQFSQFSDQVTTTVISRHSCKISRKQYTRTWPMIRVSQHCDSESNIKKISVQQIIPQRDAGKKFISEIPPEKVHS